MTEQEWYASDDSYAMLDARRMFILSRPRKARLFAVACCQRIRHLLADERSHRAVDVAARYADGLATELELHRAENLARKAHDKAFQRKGKVLACPEWAAQYTACSENAFFVATRAANFAFIAAGDGLHGGPEHAAQADLLRCIFGPPAFRAIEIDPAWLTWQDGTLVKIARTIYDEELFQQMPLLADGLEGAGCTDADILGHCRQTAQHVRGCWVIDLLLGNE